MLKGQERPARSSLSYEHKFIYTWKTTYVIVNSCYYKPGYNTINPYVVLCPLAMMANLHQSAYNLLLDRCNRPSSHDYLPEVFELLIDQQ